MWGAFVYFRRGFADDFVCDGTTRRVVLRGATQDTPEGFVRVDVRLPIEPRDE